MKKVLKTVVNVVSIASLAVVIFLGGIVVRLTSKDESGNGSKKLPPVTFGFGADRAYADVPQAGANPDGDIDSTGTAADAADSADGGGGGGDGGGDG